MTAAKFGLAAPLPPHDVDAVSPHDAAARALAGDGYRLLYEAEVDHTLFFRALGDLPAALPDADAALVALPPSVLGRPACSPCGGGGGRGGEAGGPLQA